MKKSIPGFVISTFILVSVSCQEVTLKPCGIKSWIIEYTYSGDKTGKGTLYFDDYGLKTAIYTEAFEDGEKHKGWVVTFCDYQYMWDPDDPTEGMKNHFRNRCI